MSEFTTQKRIFFGEVGGNARQNRRARRQILTDHWKWPLGTKVLILGGHHSPDAVGLVGKVSKHGYPCKDGINCNVEFDHPVIDHTFDPHDPSARFCHYVDYKHLRRVK